MKTLLQTLEVAQAYLFRLRPDYHYFFRNGDLYKIGFKEGSAISGSEFEKFAPINVKAICEVEDTPVGPLYHHSLEFEGLSYEQKDALSDFKFWMALLPDSNFNWKLVGIYGGLKVLNATVFECDPNLWCLQLAGLSNRPFLSFKPDFPFFNRLFTEADMPQLPWGASAIPLQALAPYALIP